MFTDCRFMRKMHTRYRTCYVPWSAQHSFFKRNMRYWKSKRINQNLKALTITPYTYLVSCIYRFFTISTKTKCTCLLFIRLKFSYCRIFQKRVSRVYDVLKKTRLMRCITEISRCFELKHLSCLRYAPACPFLFEVHFVFSCVLSFLTLF